MRTCGGVLGIMAPPRLQTKASCIRMMHPKRVESPFDCRRCGHLCRPEASVLDQEGFFETTSRAFAGPAASATLKASEEVSGPLET